MKCYFKKMYYVSLGKFIKTSCGFKNYISTSRLSQARYYAKRLKLLSRQIDVRERGKKTYVLKDSWR